MVKWIDRITNWGHIVIPLFIALVVFLLGRLGCHEGHTQKTESIKSPPEVSSSLMNMNKPTLLHLIAWNEHSHEDPRFDETDF